MDVKVYGDVSGQVAGHNISNHNHSHSHTTVVRLPERRRESRLQAEFAQCTGIWCPAPAREWLESLMERHNFTVRELAVAWGAKTIGWDQDNDVQQVNTPALDALFAFSVVVITGLWFVVLAIKVFIGNSHDTLVLATLGGFATGYLATCWLATRFILWPRRVAMRIRRVETREGGAVK